MIRSGRLTTLIAALLTFLPALYLWFGLGIKPTRADRLRLEYHPLTPPS